MVNGWMRDEELPCVRHYTKYWRYAGEPNQQVPTLRGLTAEWGRQIYI